MRNAVIISPHRALLFCLLLTAFNSCRDKYNSPVHAASTGFLVVEGYISNDTAATRIRLTRSVALDSARTVAESGATILVEAKSGGTAAALSENAPGNYTGNSNAVNSKDEYRLHIILGNGKEYFSDYSSPRSTPPVDSVTWSPYSDGVKIYVSTHDPDSKTHNYHWEYDETWKYTAAYNSTIIYIDPYLYPRDSAHQIYVCYQNGSSTTVLVATSGGLGKDEISRFPVADISYRSSNRLTNEYSINVKQRGMSTEALNYYQLLAKNTQELGSIFDAQPSALSGNVHSVSDPGELVFGFIECSAKTEKRIFIDRSLLPDVAITTGHGDCNILHERKPEFTEYHELFADSGYVPLSGTVTDSNYNGTYANKLCGDCRAQGGTTTKPSFWP